MTDCALCASRARAALRPPRAANDRGGRLRAGPSDRRRRRRGRARSGRRRSRRPFARRPTRAASTTMRASRGGSARREIARPSSVMRPSASIAPSDVRSARASASAPRGGGSRKFETRRIGDAPGRAVEHEVRRDRRERISGWRIGPKAAVRRLLPQAIADARLDAPGAAAPLVGVGARDAHRLEPASGRCRARKRGTRMRPLSTTTRTPSNCQRRLGDRGREHDLAPPGAARARPRGPARARPSRHRAARYRRRVPEPRARASPRRGVISPCPGRKTRIEPFSLASASSATRATSSSIRALAFASDIASLDRKGAALAFDQRRVAEKRARPARRRASPT